MKRERNINARKFSTNLCNHQMLMQSTEAHIKMHLNLRKKKRKALKRSAKSQLEMPLIMQHSTSLNSVHLVATLLLCALATAACSAKASNLSPLTRTHHQDDLSYALVNHQQSASLSKPKSPSFVDLNETEDEVQRIAVGRSVKFKCVVNSIGDHKLAWFHKDKRLLLAFDNKTVAWRERIHVSSQANSVFFLQIDNVQLEDKGRFTCQLNTQPVQSQVHTLDVVKPPQIREQETPVNLAPVKEFERAELRCVADGVPKPAIKWRRESQMFPMEQPAEEEEGEATLATEPSASSDSVRRARQAAPASKPTLEDDNIIVTAVDSEQKKKQQQQQKSTGRRSKQQLEEKLVLRQREAAASDTLVPTSAHTTEDEQEPEARANRAPTSEQEAANRSTATSNKLFIGEGEVLLFERVTRQDMGFYMCIASNGVSPSVSQRIFLPVSFASRATTSATPTTGGRSAVYLDTGAGEAGWRKAKGGAPTSKQADAKLWQQERAQRSQQQQQQDARSAADASLLKQVNTRTVASRATTSATPTTGGRSAVYLDTGAGEAGWRKAKGGAPTSKQADAKLWQQERAQRSQQQQQQDARSAADASLLKQVNTRTDAHLNTTPNKRRQGNTITGNGTTTTFDRNRYRQQKAARSSTSSSSSSSSSALSPLTLKLFLLVKILIPNLIMRMWMMINYSN